MAKREEKLLSEAEVARLLAATAGERFQDRDRALLELLYGAGLRVGELVALNVQHLDLVAGTVSVIGKGQKARTVPMGQAAVEALRVHLGGQLEGPVFASAEKPRLNSRLVQRIVSKYALKAGLPRISPHTLRHSYASHMLRRGAYLFSLAALLGHSHLETTTVYLHAVATPAPEAVHAACHPRA